MKAKNKLAILAGAVTALAAMMPNGALAAEVNSIHRMYSTTAWTAEAPARIGNEVTFRILLANNTDSIAQDSPWHLEHLGANAESLDWEYNPPMIAVKISDETRYARLVDVNTNLYDHLTVLDFKYVVKPGDLAAPMTVINDGHTLTTLNLGADLSSLWSLRDAKGNSAVLALTGGYPNMIDGVQWDNNIALVGDADVYGCGPVHIKTLDFDSTFAESGFWREVGTSGTPVPSVPRIEIGSAAGVAGTVYVWISDETGTNVSTTVAFGNGMETQDNMFNQKVHPVSIAVGDEYETFTLKGLTGSGTAYIYLSSQPSNTFYASGNMISNFTYRIVKVYQEVPSIRYEMLDYDTDVVISSARCAVEYEKPVAKLKVTLTEAWTEDITLKLNMKTGKYTAEELFASNIVRVSTAAGNWLGKAEEVVVPAGSREVFMNIYGLGASDAITFTPEIKDNASAAYSHYTTGDEYGCSIKLNPCNPEVLAILDSSQKPVVPPVFALTERKEYQFHLEIADGYNGITAGAPGYKGYTVEWDRESDKAATSINPQTFSNIVPVVTYDGKLVLPVKVIYPYAGSYAKTRIRVTNPDGGFTEIPVSGDDPVIVNVGASMKAFATPDKTQYSEGDTMNVSFRLSEAYVDLEGTELFAFLVPMNEAASNTTESVSFAAVVTNELGEVVGGTGTGIRISGTDSVASAAVALKDGYASPYNQPRFGMKLCKSETYDPTKEVDSYDTPTFYVAVSNACPSVDELYMNDIPSIEGNVFESATISGMTNTFEVIPADLGIEFDANDADVGDPDKCLIARWSFKPAGETTWTHIWKFGLSAEGGPSNQCSYVFYGDSTNNLVKVTLIDKDMRKPGDIYWEADPDDLENGGSWKTKKTFNVDALPSATYWVSVSSKPAILVVPSLDYFTEEDFLNGDLSFDVWLTPADVSRNLDLRVELNIERMKPPAVGSSNLGLIEVDSYTNTIGRGAGVLGVNSEPGTRFYVSDLDGTRSTATGDTRFRIWARVLNEEKTRNNRTAPRWCDYYEVRTNNYFAVRNSNPEIDLNVTSVNGLSPNTETNRYLVEKNVNIPVRWTVYDVVPDLTNDFTVTVATGFQADKVITYKSDAHGSVPSKVNVNEFSITDEWEFAFPASGNYQVSIRAKDKDGGYDIYTWYFTVSAGKNLLVLPHVQDGYYTSAQADDTSVYLLEMGAGSGRAWAGEGLDSGQFFDVAHFFQQWVYTPAVITAYISAKGYSEGDVEGKGALTNVVVNTVGDQHKTKGGDRYKYPSNLDSFFYRWVISTAESEGGGWSATLQKPTPQIYKTVPVTRSITLPEQQDDPTKSYSDILVEAIFSKELYRADNLGDINGDGIPDYYAALYADATGDETGLTDVNAFNDDEDYFPAAWDSGNPLNPSTPNWGAGKPFTFLYELRGIHPGLNEPDISDYDLSEAEKMTLFADWVAAEGVTPPANYNEAYAQATNWATEVGWSVEVRAGNRRRLDPTNPDTDGDGLTDGFEYFFWYYSRVGLLVDGSWRRLTGSKFHIADTRTIGSGVEIPSWVIAYAFHPWHRRGLGGVAEEYSTVTGVDLDANKVRVTSAVDGDSWTFNTKDFDEDGLSDLEEFALGTNPVNWDSDGDGLPDYYEVANGLNPLSAGDGGGNPDGDFMARASSPSAYSVVALASNPDSDKIGTLYAIEYNECYDFIESEPVDDSEKTYFKITTSKLSADVLDDTEDFYVLTNDLVTVVDASDGNIAYIAKPTRGFRPVTVPNNRDGNIDRIESVGRRVDLPAGLVVYRRQGPLDLGRRRISMVTKRGESLMTDENGNAVPAGIKVFQYGKGNGPFVPTSLNPDALSSIPTNWVVIAFKNHYNTSGEKGDTVSLTYIHNQVFNKYGFDPRTGWHKTNAGYVHPRWEHRWDDTGTQEIGSSSAGLAVNTSAYSSRDEFLLLQYRAFTGGGNAFRDDYKTYGELVADYNSGVLTPSRLLTRFTTRPNKPFDGSGSSGDGSNTTATASSSYSSTIHGADTDEDAVPDGWELYVNSDPTGGDSSEDDDLDKLSLVEEYAGTDSCLAHEDVEKIWAKYPGNEGSGKQYKWFNKFFPTNPYAADTDGDGLFDWAEGKEWTSWFYVGRNEYKCKFSFIYGDVTDDGKTRCFKGGGLNPCTVDTDGDHLPDLWEYEFAGLRDAIAKESLTALDLKRVGNAGGDANKPDYGEEPATGSSGGEDNAAAASTASANSSTNSYSIVGGMDGTSADANSDYDNDGLLNYQEYLVQSLRHLRYDDAETPLMGRQLYWPNDGLGRLTEGKFIKFMPMDVTDAEYFWEQCRTAGFTGSSSFAYRDLGYFVSPAHDWDANSGALYMFRPMGISSSATPLDPSRVCPATENGLIGGEEVSDVRAYATTDPRQWDSDNDGMDDYYELFHGLNPLLGTAVDPLADYGVTIYRNVRYYDRIACIYVGDTAHPNGITAWKNAWTGWDNDWNEWEGYTQKQKQEEIFNPMRFPWMIGTAECDADGDGLRNTEEALFVNITSPKPTHTDPTPLWMTDSTSTNFASYVSQYYGAPLSICYGNWDLRLMLDPVPTSGRTTHVGEGSTPGHIVDNSISYMFAFEENEGYDTDHDFIPDNLEVVRNVTQASDPLKAYDPPRRQGLWFDGVKSAAITATGGQQRPTSVDYDLLRQFTVEAWVKAENPESGSEQVILERASDYSASSLSNDSFVVRANFRLGIRSGRFYGEYEGSTANSGVATLFSKQVATTNWTHLALTFDGSTLSFYVNGSLSLGDTASGMTMIPANGILVMRQEAGPSFSFDSTPVFPVAESGYYTLPTAFLLGARALNGRSLDISRKPEWSDYADFFKGWVSEVRVWDGARSIAEIAEAFKTAMTFDEMAENRRNVFNGMVNGRSRNDSATAASLPAELVQHYNFSTLPGAVRPGWTATEPNGFTMNVADQVRIEGRGLEDFGGIYCGWWAATPVHSTVYANMNLVPWIANNVAHLPFLDGSSADSQYWSEQVAGSVTATTAATGANSTNTASYMSFDYANTAHPYPYYIYRNDRSWHLYRMASLDAGLARRWYFQMRSGFVGTSDLVPLGEAFAKREVTFWDGEGAMDAHELTVADTDGDGLPDWWEALYSGKIVGEGPLTWSSIVKHKLFGSEDEIEMPAWQAYSHDLVNGMLPGGIFNTIFRSVADLNMNGIPDWWEKEYGIFSKTAVDGAKIAAADTDFDGLSNLAEYLSSYGTYPYGYTNGFPRVNPLYLASSFSGQIVPDYFLPGPTNKVLVGPDAHGFDRYLGNNCYLGEIFTDHDFMEDWWERGFNKSFTGDRTYDPAKDYDGDGWSNWAECRYALWSGLYPADIVDAWLDAERDIYQKAYPRPSIGIRMTYNGNQDVSGASVVVRTRSAKSIFTDATYVIPGSGQGVQTVQDLYVGRYLENAVLHGFLNPGSLLAVNFSESPISSDQNINWHYRSGSRIIRGTSTLKYYMDNISMMSQAAIDVTGLDFRQFAVAQSSDDGRTGRVIHARTAAEIGTVDYSSGEFKIDMAAYAKNTTNVAELAAMVFTASYNYQIGYFWPQTIYVSDAQFNVSGGDHGFVKEGKNTLEVFIDMNKNGTYDAGEPFGIAKNVDVSWHKTDLIDVELTDTSPFIPRCNLSSGTSDRSVIAGASGGVSIARADDDGGAAGVDEEQTDGMTKAIRIVRQKINGIDSQKRVLLSKDYILRDRTYIHEGDVISDSRFDLDWKWLMRDAAKMGIVGSEIDSVTYAVEEVVTLDDGTVTNKPLVTFVNNYEPVRPFAVPFAPEAFTPVYSASPTFSWKCSDGTATAFKLQVRTPGAFTNLYDSGFVRLPARINLTPGEIGYRYTPRLYVDMSPTNGAANVLIDGSNYQWRVVLYNAKFTEDPSAIALADSEWTDFQMDVRNRNRYPLTRTGYGLCAAAVRYYGPMRTNDVVRSGGNIIVEAYASADFAGRPLARMRVDGEAVSIDSLTDISTVNAVLRGVDVGDVYLLAFIDQNNNGKRDSWESWGYANNVGRGVPYLYTPRAVSVPDLLTLVDAATTTIYIEDTDVNQNEIPDCLESFNDATAASSVGDGDNDGLYDDEEESADTDAANWDTDHDGMPDGWEAKFTDYGVAMGTDPITPDGEESIDGDMMAYEEVNAWLVTYGDGDSRPALVLPSETLLYPPQVNKPLGDYTAYDWYSYGIDRYNPSLYGIGTNVTADAYITNVQTVRAVRVHAQVYAKYGFETGVATEHDTVGRSKKFTNLDKYLVVRYLQAIGYDAADEHTMNTNGVVYTSETADHSLWARWTVRPNTADGNYDGIADGWQLYVMFGQTDTDLANVAGAMVTPWTSPAKARELSPGGGLSWRDEFDMRRPGEKYLPTNPWVADTNGDGISDADAYNFHLKEGDLRGDDDNDQLSNFVEFLVTRGCGSDARFPEVFADRRISHSKAWGGNQFVPDYFLRVGSLYLGEMFTDFDFMESYLEMSNEVHNAVGVLDSFKYDAHLDSDGDGWSNFSELRAFLEKGTMLVDMGVVTNSDSRTGLTSAEALAIAQDLERKGLKHKTSSDSASEAGYMTWDMGDGTYGISWDEITNEYRTVTAYPGTPVPTVTVDVYSFGGQSVSNCTVKAWADDDSFASEPEAVWNECPVIGGKLILKEPDEGRLTEGMHKFVVIGDSGTSGKSDSSSGDASSAWTPGAPYGIATKVDVGWKQGSFSVGLTCVNSSVMRFDIAGMCNANTFDAQRALNDRGVVGMIANPNVPAPVPGTNTTLTSSGTRVRVIRAAVNGKSSYKVTSTSTRFLSDVDGSVVFDRYINTSVTPEFTEALLVEAGKVDLDMAQLKAVALSMGISVSNPDAASSIVTSMTYQVVIGNDAFSSITTNNVLATMFENVYESGSAQTKAAPISPSGSLLTLRPTFKWTHLNTIGKAYPAFRLRVYKGSGSTPMYDSGIRLAPPRDSNGVYTWTPDDLHVGEVVADGQVFANDTQYTWSVSMIDAKFYEPNSNETRCSFRTAVSGDVLSNKGTIEVAVKYFGPVATSASTTSLSRLVRVEAFDSPDFSGAPAAATYAKNVDTMSATNQITFNAQLIGLPSATNWYVRAFIDTNGNRIRDVTESWGYGCYVNTDRKDVWTPRAYTISAESVMMPEAVIYIEDVDTDGNGLPDAYSGSVSASTTPYIVMLQGTPSAVNLYAHLDKGVVSLPYVSTLTHFDDDKAVSALRLGYAMAMAGLPTADPLLDPIVRITSFSPTNGIDIAVDVPTTIDPATLKAKKVGITAVNVSLALYVADSLDGEWTKAGASVTQSFDVDVVDGRLDQSKLDALNEALKAKINGVDPSKFFKVVVE